MMQQVKASIYQLKTQSTPLLALFCVAISGFTICNASKESIKIMDSLQNDLVFLLEAFGDVFGECDILGFVGEVGCSISFGF